MRKMQSDNMSKKHLREIFVVGLLITMVFMSECIGPEKRETEKSWTDLRINSSAEALNAYRNGISSDYFIGKIKNVSDSGNILPPENGCYVGAFPGMRLTGVENATTEDLQQFETLCGKSVAIAWSTYCWDKNISLKQILDEVGEYGAVPVIGLRLEQHEAEAIMDEGNPSVDFSLQKIIDGDLDNALSINVVDEVKRYNKPVMISFLNEMNGDWYPWCGIYQGGDGTTEFGDSSKADGPERYIATYRHVVELFRAGGVNNVTWLFQANDISYPNENWNSIDAYYPGDEYVDWVGISLYVADAPDDEWASFETRMELVYNELIFLFPNKPIMLAEWGVGEFPEKGDKAAWISEAFTTLQSKYTCIKCAIYYHAKWEND